MHTYPAALVAVECRARGRTEPFFRQEVQTDKNGQFRLQLPPLSHLKACSVQLLRTTTTQGQTYCSLPVTSSNSIRIKSRKKGTIHVFSAHGIFTFKPMKQHPDLCSQNPISHSSSPSKFHKPKPTITITIDGFFDPIPPIPLLPPPSLIPPIVQPPSLLPPILPSPPSLLPPNPFNPPSPPSLLPPNPFKPPSPPSLLPPNPFPIPPLIPGLLPSPPPPPPAFPIPLPPLIPIPPFPGIPPASSSSSTKKTSSP